MACSIAALRKWARARCVKIRHEGFAGAPESARDHAEGWTRVLGWMQAFVENGKTIDTRKASKVCERRRPAVPCFAHRRGQDAVGQPARRRRYIYAIAPNRTDTSFDTPGSCMVTP